MKLRYYPFELKFKHPFAIAAGKRDFTPVVYVELEYENKTGYGEAALPPYLPETQESVIKFLSLLDVKQFTSPVEKEKILDYVFRQKADDFAAKAAFDIALHDLAGKVLLKPCHKMFGLKKENCPQTTFTIGMDTPKMILEKVSEAKDFNLLKIKLGGPFDKLIIETIRKETNKPICIDANQGWDEKEFALDMIHYLKEQGAIFIEQPLEKNKMDDACWLKEKSPLPIIADEAVQTFDDIAKIKDAYHGINIKLMKCGGMSQALKMIFRAREQGLKILIGCMSESSCGVSAAAQLSPLSDWADLDGPLLISNDPFKGITYSSGKIVLNDFPGNGIEKID
ncbi:MAG TPA: dipeptide epimerase [Bacteroidia bacterium]|nr:dipeptide epimerase [Bacteroidia bacterium]